MNGYRHTNINKQKSGSNSLPKCRYLCGMTGETGKWIMIIGVILVVAGALIYFFHDKLSWIGKLPGDIRIEKENFRFYFPLTSMILLSALLTLLVRLFRK